MLGNKLKWSLSPREANYPSVASELLTKESQMRMSTLNLLANGDFRERKTVVVRKTHASLERGTKKQEAESPT